MPDQPVTFDPSSFTPLGHQPQQSIPSAPLSTDVTFDPTTFKPLGGTSATSTQTPGVGEQIAQGFGSAAATGLAGLGKLGSHIPGVPEVAEKVGDVLGLPKLEQQPGQPAPNPYDITQKSTESNAAVAQKTIAGKSGAVLENIAEFMAGEEALKGLSEIERLQKLMPLMKMFRDSPKLLAAAKAAMTAAKTGVIMGGQEAAHGGTASDVAKQAAVGAGLGIAGSAVWGAGKAGFQALQKAGFSGAALDAATKIAAENVKPAEEITDTLQHKLNNTESVMHTSFDNAMEDMRGKIGTEPVPLSGSPLHEAAVKLAAEAEHLPQGITAGLRGLVPAEGNMAGLLQGLTDGTVKDMTGSQLIDLRQQLSKQLPRVAPAIKQGVGDLLEGIDSTLDKMAGEAGNVEGVSTDYTAARGAYRQSLKDLKEPFVQRIRDGKMSDVLKSVMSGAQDAPYKVGVLKRLLGDDTVAAAGLNKFADVIKGATSDEGELSVKKAITEWDKLSDEVKKSMFSATPEVGQRLEQIMDGLRTVAKTRAMIKWGVGAAGALSAAAGTYGIATGQVSPTSAIETIAGLAGILGVAKFGGGGELLEDLASNRKLLSGLGKLYGYSGENIVGRLGAGGTETAEQLAKMSAEGPALASPWDKIKSVAGNLSTGSEEGAVGNVTKRKAGEPGTSSLIGKRGVQGGHAGGGVTSEEELSRPGKNYIVSKSGNLTYHGKSFAPEETPAGAAHVTVLPDGTFRTNEGTLTPSMEAKLRAAEPLPKQPKGGLGVVAKTAANQADDIALAAKSRNEKGSAKDIVDDFNKSKGKSPVVRPEPIANPEGKNIAAAYDAMKHDPNDPTVKASYDSLKKDIDEQWTHAQENGLKFEPWDKAGQPYKNSKEMMQDVADNKHLYFFKGGDIPADHPLATVDPKTGLTYNDKFRAVHDLYGHAAHGFQFGPAGEEAAYKTHVQTLSPESVPALTTETRGQNNWVNFGKHMQDDEGNLLNKEDAGYLSPQNRPYAEQKAGILPQKFQNNTSLDLTHYSDVAGLTETNPEMHGTGVRGAERNRMKEPGYLPRTYFGTEGYKEPAVQGKPYSYKSQIDPSKIYDIAKDPEGIWQKGFAKGGATGAENAVHDAGYAGYQHDGVVAAFDKMPVTAVNPTNSSASEIGTRRPTSVKSSATNDPNLLSGKEALDQAEKSSPSRISESGTSLPGVKQKMAAAFADYKDNGLVFSPEELQNPDTVLDKTTNHLKGNLKWLYNQIPDSIKNVSKDWYKSANIMTKQMANENGVSHEQAAAVTAALSPQTPWDTNVGLAKRLIEHYTKDQSHAWTSEMDDAATRLRNVPTASEPFKRMISDLRGKRLDQLNAKTPEALQAKKALWYRLLDEAHGADDTPVYSPDGTVRGHQTIAWGGLDPIAKALNILDDGSVQNIHESLGTGHKVRNFYNNIISPDSPRGHTTVDTHAVGAAWLKPLSSKDTEALHNFGSGNRAFTPSPPKHAETGLKGSYPIYEEAYKQAASELGIKPRELQSITWEGIRSLMGDDKKTPELKRAVQTIWQDHENGDLTIDQARDKIVKAAGGFTKPAWMPHESWKGKAEPEETSFNFGANE